jgi:trimethylamine:corrinoid methyltransferase-like protein
LEEWEAAGRPDVLEESREEVDRILSTHQPLALDEEIDRELDRIRKRAAESLL